MGSHHHADKEGDEMIMANAFVKITFSDTGKVNYEYSLGGMKKDKFVDVRVNEYQLVEEACIYARLFAREARQKRRAFRKQDKAEALKEPKQP
jgi:hypothetical protein